MKIKHPTRISRRRLFVEGLECRELLAGNVAVSLAGGHLRITGDGQANQIAVYQQTNGRFNITGADGFTGPTTNLVVRSITANLQGGDDSIIIAAQPGTGGFDVFPATVIGAVTVNGGQGSDVVVVSVAGRVIGQVPLPNLAVTVDGGAQSSGSQDDQVIIAGSSTAALSVRTYSGADSVNLTNVLALNAMIDSGIGGDEVFIQNSAALSANITLGTLTETGSTNELTANSSLFGTLNVWGSGVTDLVEANSTNAGFAMNVFTYGGDDTVALTGVRTGLTQQDIQNLANSLVENWNIDVSQLPFDYAALIARLPGTAGMLNVFTGNGNDTVALNVVISTLLINVLLENGSDSLVATNVEADFALFNGGAGTDGQFIDVDAVLSLLMFENELPDPGQGGT